jgi:hypothetical protein
MPYKLDHNEGQIRKFDSNGNLVFALVNMTSFGIYTPRDIAVDRDDNMWITDYHDMWTNQGNSRVVKISPDGEFLFEFGGSYTVFNSDGYPPQPHATPE